ncbi:DUF7344 domain-containing protein [Natrinema longum]|uniref:DUF7344 domain-containing protein n=1 Tax=Natrinema longum TaxID=370324 RepID=A0A8A2U9W8_9EURY|nr:hypothetical protein [Natrinema longum]MBZ6496724.1 hypothetical protein [Natrinema longum]QSW85383.1 hypothetical protein J0X27_00590 [Natrinema longum]
MNNSVPSGSPAAPREVPFDVLADARRRTAVRLVHEGSPEGVGKHDLGYQLAAVISDKPLAAITDGDHQRALVDLHHRLLPQLTDAGLLEEGDDETIRTADHPVFDESAFEAVITGDHTADADELDTMFGALANERRRTILAVLDDQFHPIATETLARDVAVREAETTQRAVPRERVDEVLASLVHVHLPVLHDATLVGYDAESGRVSDERHSALRGLAPVRERVAGD